MLSLKFGISTHASTGRPIISWSTETGVVKCLIDTGADTPAWFSGKEMLKAFYPDAYYMRDVRISGFGGSGSSYELWCIPVFKLHDKSSSVTFKNLYIAVIDDYKCFDILLSITAFSRMRVDLDMLHGSMKIESRRSDYFGYIARDINGDEHFQVLLEDDDIAADYAAATQKMLRDTGLKGN